MFYRKSFIFPFLNSTTLVIRKFYHVTQVEFCHKTIESFSFKRKIYIDNTELQALEIQ